MVTRGKCGKRDRLGDWDGQAHTAVDKIDDHTC